MKTKFIFLALFVVPIMLLNESVIAFRDSIGCKELESFCKHVGYFSDLKKADEEFKMLLGPIDHPDFQQAYASIIRFLDCACSSEEYMLMLSNQKCKVSEYSQKLLAFYNTHKEEITDNIKNEDPDLDIIKKLDILRGHLQGKYSVSPQK